jgi:uncharacterized protein (DUF1810 family)
VTEAHEAYFPWASQVSAGPGMPGLQRFVDAQHAVYTTALAELRAGRKRTHWMWFIFPQLVGLGRSATSGYYGIASLEEAREYLAHPVLGPRLLECTEAVNSFDGKSAREVFGAPDDLKFHSSMTLFHLASPETECFKEALGKYFGGELDQGTVKLLSAAPNRDKPPTLATP